MGISICNTGSNAEVVEIYTTTAGNVVQEWLMNGNVNAHAILSNKDKIWLPVGYKIRFKTASTNNIIISANLYG